MSDGATSGKRKWEVDRARVGAKEDLLVLKPMKRIVLVSRELWQPPFNEHPLVAGGPSISLFYELRKGDAVLKSGNFTISASKETLFEIPVDKALEAMTEVVLWGEPYGHAAIVYPEAVATAPESGRGRVHIPTKAAIYTGESFYEFQVISGVVPYIVGEMNTNKTSANVVDLARLNRETPTGISPTAYTRWINLVKPGAPWDHKPVINRVWGPRQRFGHLGYSSADDRIYRSDIHSNIHYGYVGRAAGFSIGELLRGASAAQRLSNIGHGDWPSGDPAEDVQTIQAGFDLFGEGGDVTVTRVLEVIRAHDNWQWRPA